MKSQFVREKSNQDESCQNEDPQPDPEPHVKVRDKKGGPIGSVNFLLSNTFSGICEMLFWMSSFDLPIYPEQGQ